MTDRQITALAREYAEFTDMSEVDKKNISAICKYFLKYTLRRYCLVEKSKVDQMYKEAVEGKCELEKMQPQKTYAKNSILMKVGNGGMFTREQVKELLVKFAQLFPGKQEKDAERSKEKLMCLRDRTKVCNRCHACDIDTDAWHSMYSR